ncbi:putative E3 ubiquitin-protein ligase listerin [Glarea lozoyensis 74030]|uniref:E3 ubiquitin-protein ligase listerin n=1 Tax=Glarea lozoyensis (strain ATCC 74030 / MF5533) TaxID=1104152 RepID=H0EES7_GLAL7|nr:putative E3 ubiquitin-protein ligase listerin [Glarea lozoyensis 74030]
MELTAILLEVTELSDKSLASRAQVLKHAIETTSEQVEENNHGATLELLRWNLELEPTNQRILRIETLIQQAEAFKTKHKSSFPATSLFPNAEKWSACLTPVLARAPNPALGVMRPFNGAVLLGNLQSSVKSPRTSVVDTSFAISVRMALYTSHFIEDIKLMARVPTEELLSLLHALLLTVEVVSDELDLLAAGETPDWAFGIVEDEIDELHNAKGWESSSNETNDNHSVRVIRGLINVFLQHANNGPGQYYATKALSHLVSNLWRGLAINKLINTYCNRLVSDIAGASATAEKTFIALVKLNAALAVYQEDEIPVASNRLIFAVKQISSWSPDLATTNRYVAAEACRALQILLPAIKDVYGTYWESALSLCTSIWESSEIGNLSDEDLPMIGMSLKLYSILRKMEDANDDLEEALAKQAQPISNALVRLLKLGREKEHQPSEFVDTLLLRQLRYVSAEKVEDADELYPLLASENKNLQSAAYDLLQRALPQIQQQISVNVLLEGKVARLPDELLSLLLDPPSIENFSDEQLDEFPLTIRGYLLSWHLVYESELLKSENYIDPLLTLLFDLLSTYNGISGDLSKFEPSMISRYEIWTAFDSESPKRDMSWLLVNLYYLCLKYTPNLTRNWWLDCKSKQIKLAASKLTDKVFSPILIQEVKDDVTKWASEQDTTDDKKELIVKTSKNSADILAGVEIDETMMQIVVSLPTEYPLQGVEVRGVNRVAVNEKTWRAWQVIAQGVMRLNTIVDGLILFRDNVGAAMAGKTECAICYSIIATDKRMPDKRCGTCKNLFHAGA